MYPPNAPSPQLRDALDICLQAMLAGADIDTALTIYPNLASELGPLLKSARKAQLISVHTVPHEAMNRSRTLALGRAAELRRSRKPLLTIFHLPRLISSTLTFLLVGIVSLFFINTVSARALPGDTLYPLKLTLETLWLQNPSIPIRQNLETAYQQRRIEEIENLLANGRQEQVRFEGVLTQTDLLSGVAAEQWDVNGLRVLIMPETTIIGDIQIGMFIAVEGLTEPGLGVVATRIMPKAYSFIGIVESISLQIWQVSGKRIQIEDTTQIDAGIEVGQIVLVLAGYNETGLIIARAILKTSAEVNDPTPTLVIEPTIISTPSITLTPTPTETITKTSTLSGTPEPTKTITASPTSTPIPPSSLTPTKTNPEPSAEPEDTPEPSAEPEDTPEPSAEPEDTPEPPETKEPTETPEP
jgi:hypothetical protein